MRSVITLFFILFRFTYVKTDEFFELKVFNRDFRASDSEIHAIIERANLTARGYKKEVTTKLVQNADGGAPDYQACHSVCICKTPVRIWCNCTSVSGS